MGTALSGRRIREAGMPDGVGRSRRWLGIVVAGVALAACGGGGSGGGGGGGGPPTGPNPPTDASTVTMQDNLFNPATRTVTAGTTVRWVNNGSVQHNTTSNTGLWASPNLNNNGQFERVFSTAGTFQYNCTLHPGMTGTIVVTG